LKNLLCFLHAGTQASGVPLDGGIRKELVEALCFISCL